MSSTSSELIALRAAIIAKEPQLRARDLAARLNISEAELVALGKEGVETVRLKSDWPAIISAVGALGRVMGLTRNESCVHERKGVYGALGGGAHVGLIVGEDIDLRIFFGPWRSGFSVVEGDRRSLQFFDAQGMAIHKIYLTDQSNIDAFNKLVIDFTAEDTVPLVIEPQPARRAPLADNAIDVSAFHAAWDAMVDTHQFHGLLMKFKLERTQALRLAGEHRATPIDVAAARRTLSIAAERETPIMVFVGNPGMIQIHTGPVTNLKPMGPWFNVMDEKFNLHLREDHIASAWVVYKPTEDGIVTSLELYDDKGETIATLFGKRKPGQPEDEAWRAIVSDLFAKEAA